MGGNIKMNITKNIINLIPKPLTVKGFAPYGQAVLGSKGKPNYKGNGWISLFSAGKTHVPQGELGWVLTKIPKQGLVVAGMEREPEVEIIWPVTGPLIHVVALPGNLKKHSEQPDALTAKAFIIYPGQVIIMHPGTWHYASFPLEQKETFYYFLTKDHPREPGWEDVPWVPLKNNAIIKIKL